MNRFVQTTSAATGLVLATCLAAAPKLPQEFNSPVKPARTITMSARVSGLVEVRDPWGLVDDSKGAGFMATGAGPDLFFFNPVTDSSRYQALPGVDRSEQVAVVFSPDGKKAVTVTGGLMRLWERQLPKLQLLGTSESVGGGFSAQFSPDGKWVAAGAGNRRIYHFDAFKLQVNWLWNGGGDVNSLVFLENDKLVTSGHKTPITIWDLKTAREEAVLGKARWRSGGLALSPDGKLLASAGTDLRGGVPDVAELTLWDVKTRKRRDSIQLKNVRDPSRLVFSHSGQYLVVSGNGHAAVFDLKKKPTERLVAHFVPRGFSLLFSRDDKWLVSAGDKEIRIYSFEDILKKAKPRE